MNTDPITFRELAEVTLDQREEQGIKGFSREQSRYRVHVVAASFIDMPLAEITPKHIRAWLREMAAKDAIVSAKQEPRKLDATTISRAQSLVSAVFAEAVEREVIETNPCIGVKLKKRATENDTVEKWSYLMPAEQKAIVECPNVTEAEKLAIRFAIGTGLRQSEMTNLELADLHVGDSEPHVYVRYSVPLRRKDGTTRKMPPKSGKKRRVPLLPDALAAARSWLAMLPTFAPSNPYGIVFPTPNGCYRQQGKPLGRSRTIHDVYRAAGVKARKGLHWHALRHTFASNLISGVLGRRWSLEEIQVLLGHSTTAMTSRYAHLGEDAIKQAVRETNAAAAPPAPDTEPTPLELLPDALDTMRDLGLLDEEEAHAVA